MADAYKAPESDVVVTSRVRLARNFEDIPFVPSMNEVWAAETVNRAIEGVAKSPQKDAFKLVRISDISATESQRMVEQHLISFDLLKNPKAAAVLLSKGATVNIMVNEEDHLRIQGLLPGLQLERAAELAFSAEDWLSEKHHFAYDEQWGYLTSCPTNTGTGMRASLMMHLPAITRIGQMGAIVQAVSKIGLTVRGLYGEGSEAQGYLYQLSNQVTLGRSEEDIIRSLQAASEQIIKRERELRDYAIKQDEMGTKDKLLRSLGILKHARVMSSVEFMEKWSDVRLASSMGLINMDIKALDDAMIHAQPASISLIAGGEQDAHNRDVYRASWLRELLKDVD